MADNPLRLGTLGGLHCTWREAEQPGGPLILLLHGLSGDEQVMWGLDRIIPRAAFVVSPRAPLPFAPGGFTWVDPGLIPGAPLEAYDPSARLLAEVVTATRALAGERRLVLMGFSQGAALALSAVALGRLSPEVVVVIAGLLPPGELPPWPGVPVFWGHGLRDELVPIERARDDVARLERAGAPLTYCEADVGHRLGPECLRGVRGWLAARGLDEPPTEA